jgi:hypothetical protein
MLIFQKVLLQPLGGKQMPVRASLTSVADCECGKFAGAPVKISAAVDEHADEARLQDRLIEGGVISAQVAHHIAGPCPHLPLYMF